MYARFAVRLRAWKLNVAQEGRAAALEMLATAKKQACGLEKELHAYGACDPVKVEDKRRAVTLAYEAAMRWTGRCSRCDGREKTALMGRIFR